MGCPFAKLRVTISSGTVTTGWNNPFKIKFSTAIAMTLPASQLAGLTVDIETFIAFWCLLPLFHRFLGDIKDTNLFAEPSGSDRNRIFPRLEAHHSSEGPGLDRYCTIRDLDSSPHDLGTLDLDTTNDSRQKQGLLRHKSAIGGGNDGQLGGLRLPLLGLGNCRAHSRPGQQDRQHEQQPRTITEMETIPYSLHFPSSLGYHLFSFKVLFALKIIQGPSIEGPNAHSSKAPLLPTATRIVKGMVGKFPAISLAERLNQINCFINLLWTLHGFAFPVPGQEAVCPPTVASGL